MPWSPELGIISTARNRDWVALPDSPGIFRFTGGSVGGCSAEFLGGAVKKL
jgi:hypothetical protein